MDPGEPLIIQLDPQVSVSPRVPPGLWEPVPNTPGQFVATSSSLFTPPVDPFASQQDYIPLPSAGGDLDAAILRSLVESTISSVSAVGGSNVGSDPVIVGLAPPIRVEPKDVFGAVRRPGGVSRLYGPAWIDDVQDPAQLRAALLDDRSRQIGLSEGYCYQALFTNGVAPDLGPFPTAATVSSALLTSNNRLRACALVHDPLAGVAHVFSASPFASRVNFPLFAAAHPNCLIGSTLLTNVLSSAHADNIIGDSLNRFRQVEANAVEVCSTILGPKDKAVLESWSIPVSSFPTGRAPHPVLKALENHRNVNILPMLLRGTVNIVSMKMAKARALAARCPNADIRVFNPIITPADVTRFTEQPTLPPHAQCDMIVFDDCLHHLTPEAVAGYFVAWGAQRAIGTCISPPETWSRKASLYPGQYSIQYLGPVPEEADEYVFLPADNESASYQQAIGDNGWYDLGSFRCGLVDYDVENLFSFGPYHIMSIISGMVNPVRKSHRTFCVPKVIRLPELPGMPEPHSPWFPIAMFGQAVFHAGSLRKLGQADVLARIRGLFNTTLGADIPLDTWDHFSAVCRIAGLKVASPAEVEIRGSLWDRIKLWVEYRIRDVLPGFVCDLFFVDRGLLARVRAVLNQEQVHFVVELRHDVIVDPAVVPPPGHLPPIPAVPLPPAPGPVLPPAPAPPVQAQPPPVPPPVAPPQVLRAPLVAPGRRLPAAPGRLRSHAPADPQLPLLCDVPLALNMAPQLNWEVPAEPVNVPLPDQCGVALLVDLGVVQPDYLQVAAIVNNLSATARQAFLQRRVTTAAFFHVAGLLYGYTFEMHYPVAGPREPPLVGIRDGIRLQIFGVVQPNGDGHWQAAPPVAEQLGPLGEADGPFFEGGSSLTADFIRACNPDNFQPFDYQPNLTGAKMLFDEMESGTTGLITRLDLWPRYHKPFYAATQARTTRSVPVLYFSGLAGCGKSQRVRNAIRSDPQRFLDPGFLSVVSPLNALNQDWLSKFPTASTPQRKVFKTHEKALFMQPRVLVLDEAQKYPGYYLDFYVTTHSSLEFVILLGDPYQCGAAIVNPNSVLPLLAAPGIACAPLAQEFRAFTYRINKQVADAWKIDVAADHNGQVRIVPFVPPNVPIIVATVAAQNVNREYSQNAYTLSSCGGLEFNSPYCVILTRELLSGVPERAIYTGFTRSSRDIYVFNAMTPEQTRRALTAHPLLDSLFSGVPLVDDITAYIESPRINVPPTTLIPFFEGGKLLTVGEVLANQAEDPLTKHDSLVPVMRAAMLSPGPQRVQSDVTDVHVQHAPPHDEWMPSYFGQESSPVHSNANAGYVREDLEFQTGLHMGQMLDDVHEPNASRLESLADFFPVHRTNDPALFGPTIAKRLRFQGPIDNELEFEGCSFIGPLLANAFKEEFSLPDEIPFDFELFDRCVDDCARKRLSKSLASLDNLARDQDPDLRSNYHVLNFLKGQLINKLDAISRVHPDGSVHPAIKPAQMITTYTEEINSFFGPLTRYLAVMLRRLAPKHVLVYGGMSLTDLDEWSREHVPADLKTAFTNDYTAYDKSCRGESLQFETVIMRLFSVPEEFIDLHVDLTTHLMSSLGHLGIMRTSGQWCTYLFNSWFNAAYFRLKYDYDLSTPRGYSGDDMFILCVPTVRKGWRSLSPYFALVGKPLFSKCAEFCGWILTAYGIIRHPLLIRLKTLYHEAHGSLQSVLINYYLEHAFTCRVGDRLHEVLPMDLVGHHGSNVRFFAKHWSGIPSCVVVENVAGSVVAAAPSWRLHQLGDIRSVDWRHIPGSLRSFLLGL